MRKKLFSESVKAYQDQLVKSDIKATYEKLTKYIIRLRGHFSRIFSEEYVCGNVLLGYLDYTYFYFYNPFLREQKLRFGIVLNHQKMCFELWLMGQNEPLQKKYWELLKSSPWNEGRERPRYSVLEVVLVKEPDWDDLEALSVEIEKQAEKVAGEVMEFLLKIK